MHPVHICSLLKKCVLVFHSPLNSLFARWMRLNVSFLKTNFFLMQIKQRLLLLAPRFHRGVTRSILDIYNLFFLLMWGIWVWILTILSSLINIGISVIGSSFFYLDLLFKVKPFLSEMSLEAAFILTRRDYCNSLYWSIQKSHISHLQVVQNAAARFLKLTKFTLVTPLLKDIQVHWFPVIYRIKFKMICL